MHIRASQALYMVPWHPVVDKHAPGEQNTQTFQNISNFGHLELR